MSSDQTDFFQQLRNKHPLPLLPQPERRGLTTQVHGHDHENAPITLNIVEEQAWTLYRNDQEIVTVMTVGDYPVLLGLGYLVNQQLLTDTEDICGIDVDDELRVIVVRTNKETETPLSRQVRTSGCAEGTMYEKIIQQLATKVLTAKTTLTVSQMQDVLRHINQLPSLYLSAGAIHGCVLCHNSAPLAYLEDVGRHNAVDKIAGLMHIHRMDGEKYWLYTTGRLTTEMVLKAVQMNIPILVSRSGFTAAGVALARQCDLTLIGRAKGKRFQLLSHPSRLNFSPPNTS